MCAFFFNFDHLKIKIQIQSSFRAQNFVLFSSFTVEIIVPFSCPNTIPLDTTQCHEGKKKSYTKERERETFVGFINKFLNGHDEFLHVKMQAFFFPAHEAPVISQDTFPH